MARASVRSARTIPGRQACEIDVVANVRTARRAETRRDGFASASRPMVERYSVLKRRESALGGRRQSEGFTYKVLRERRENQIRFCTCERQRQQRYRVAAVRAALDHASSLIDRRSIGGVGERYHRLCGCASSVSRTRAQKWNCCESSVHTHTHAKHQSSPNE